MEVHIEINFWPEVFHDGSPYHIDTSPMVCTANQWIGSYMIGTSVMKELKIG